jgi:hypothetical protein
MGLDQYAYYCDAEALGDAKVDFQVDELDATEFCYWRKHPDLHGWMEKLYRDKGGTDESFNCTQVRLDINDLDLLEADLKSLSLPTTTGFFFGKSSYDEWAIERDLEFIRNARNHILHGRAVYYTSWW